MTPKPNPRAATDSIPTTPRTHSPTTQEEGEDHLASAHHKSMYYGDARPGSRLQAVQQVPVEVARSRSQKPRAHYHFRGA